MPKKRLDEAIDAKLDKPQDSKQAVVKSNNFDKLKLLTKQLNDHYKKPIIKTGKDIPTIKKVPWREPMLDYAYDGGAPIGRFIEGIGQEHSGKTRNALISMGKFQKYCFNCHTPDALEAEWELDKEGFPNLISCSCSSCTSPETKIQVMVDIEGTTDPKFMQNFGININGIIYLRPDLLSTAVDIVDAYMRNPMIGMILVDSVASQGSDKETENSMVDNKMNQNALFLNQACRKWQAALNYNTNETGKENGCTLYVINQSYQTLSMYSTEVAQGGRGLRHGKGISCKTRIKEKVKDKNENIIGVHIVIENLKNKTGMPYRKCEYYLNLDPTDPIGYCKTNVALQYIELAIMFNIIEQKGGWYYLGADKWQGKGKIIDDINNGSPLAEQLKEEVDKILYN